MRIYVVDLESVPTRYTCEWKWHVENLLKTYVHKHNKHVEIINISGGESSIEATPGAFLNFQQTNIYKNNQLNEIARRFTNEIKSGDKFVFLDAWHTGILQLKYMSELLGIPVEIHGLWHAGSYDPQDFLGRLVKDKSWTYNTERALFHAIDVNWFATEFHIDMFCMNLLNTSEVFVQEWRGSGKISITGWPMEYMPDMFAKYDSTVKEDIIIFPHRIAPEKQLDIFKDLEKSLPEYKFVVCQENKLTKTEYHKLLAKSKIMWSANLQETLGISPFEGALLGVVPMLPDRLSYSEMYSDTRYLYTSEWTESFNSYKKHKQLIIDDINYIMENYEHLREHVDNELAPHLCQNYFTATNLVKSLVG